MIARRIYRLLLYLHPPQFGERFAREMLWVFDRTVEDEGVLTLLADVALSLFKQHLATDTAPRCAGNLFQQSSADSLRAVRFFQASAIALPMSIGFFSLLQQSVPLPKPGRGLAVRRYVPDVCGELVVAVRPSEHRHDIRVAPAVPRLRP